MNSQVTDKKRIILLTALSVLLVCCVVGIAVLAVPAHAFCAKKGTCNVNSAGAHAFVREREHAHFVRKNLLP